MLSREHRCRIKVVALLNVVLFSQACGHSSPASNAEHADKILVLKSARTLSLLKGTRVLKTYSVALGRNPIGAKVRIGDHETPEGNYIIDVKKSNSRFHRALHISYPNQLDRERAKAAGVDPGGDVEIHGIENGLGWIGSLHRRIDWTDGCIAMTDGEIDEIWSQVAVGSPVEIRP